MKESIPNGKFCYSSSDSCPELHSGEKHNFKLVCEKYNKELKAEGGCIEKLSICSMEEIYDKIRIYGKGHFAEDDDGWEGLIKYLKEGEKE